MLISLGFAAGPAAADAVWLVDRTSAIAFTLGHNPGVLAAIDQRAAAKSHVIQANALPNPQLNAAVTGFNPQNQSGQTIVVQLTQTLQVGDLRRYKVTMADADIQAADGRLSLALQQAVLVTRKAYNQALAMRFARHLAEENVAWSQQLCAAAQAKLALGELPPIEAARARVALAQAQQDALGAANDDFQALEALKLAMGYLQPIDLRPNAPYATPLLTLPPLDALVARGLAHRPELTQSEAALRHERANAHWLQASVLPGFDLSTGGGPTAGVPGLSGAINVALPLWYRQEGELAESEATQSAIVHTLLATRQAVQVQIEQTYRQLALDEDQIRLYERRLLPNARSLLEQIRQRYLYGDASGYELQDARRSYRQAMAAYGQAYLAYRNALADLEVSVGAELAPAKE